MYTGIDQFQSAGRWIRYNAAINVVREGIGEGGGNHGGSESFRRKVNSPDVV